MTSQKYNKIEAQYTEYLTSLYNAAKEESTLDITIAQTRIDTLVEVASMVLSRTEYVRFMTVMSIKRDMASALL